MQKKLLMAVLLAGSAVTSYAQQEPEKLSSMSIEDLLNVEVTSVSKTEQKLSQTASAIYVITQEDIKSSGATNIPDLLRMVPGMDVAQINANTWAISARGFNRRYADGLMVLLDGRSIYLPTFGGVYWDVLDLPLENIDRIEVIRGPGGIDLRCEHCRQWRGQYHQYEKASQKPKRRWSWPEGGNLDRGFGTLQYGGAAGKTTDYRVYSKYFSDSQLPGVTGADGGDGWNILRGGFRVDSAVSAKDTLTFQGDVYTGTEDQFAKFLPSINSRVQSVEWSMDLSGGFLQAIWNHEFSALSASVLEISYDRYQRGNIVNEGEGKF